MRLIEECMKHGLEGFYHPTLVYISLSHIDTSCVVLEFLGLEHQGNNPRSLPLCKHRIVCPFEIHHNLSPECMWIARHLMVKRPRASNTLALFLRIMRKPAIHAMQLKPEDTPVPPEYLAYRHALHTVEVIDCLDSWSESCTVPLRDIWHFCHCEGFE